MVCVAVDLSGLIARMQGRRVSGGMHFHWSVGCARSGGSLLVPCPRTPTLSQDLFGKTPGFAVFMCVWRALSSGHVLGGDLWSSGAGYCFSLKPWQHVTLIKDSHEAARNLLACPAKLGRRRHPLKIPSERDQELIIACFFLANIRQLWVRPIEWLILIFASCVS